MTAGVLGKLSDVAAPVRSAGGDNEVPRDAKDRPRIIVPCTNCTETPGKIPSPKTGKPINCPKCRKKWTDKHGDPIEVPVGHILKSYTRTTTFIDVLEDKSNLQAWGERMTLVGVAKDQRLLEDVLLLDEQTKAGPADCKHTAAERKEMEPTACLSCEVKKAKDELNRKAQIAKKTAGAEEKADKGTELHSLSELVDLGLALPTGASLDDILDLDAYRCATERFKIVHMEKLVVSDELQVAGTPDRVSSLNRNWIIDHRYDDGAEWGIDPNTGEVYLIAPDGTRIMEDEELITDYKTGTTDYGGLKMAMQLALYAHSRLYDHKTGERTPFRKINQKWGVIMNGPAGSGECTLLWADLELGWRAVLLAREVREVRKAQSRALVSFGQGATQLGASAQV